MEIRKTETPSRELLLLADEVEASVADYIGRGTCYAACDDGRIVGQYVLIHTRPFTAEVVNIAVVPDRQRQGIATALLAHAVDTARRAGFRLLEIGTGNSGFGQIALYERCGFVRCGIDVDYFRKHSPTPIFENGELVYTLPTLSEISEYAKREMETFWDEYKRLHSPHRYKVDLSKPLYELKRGMLEERRSKA